MNENLMKYCKEVETEINRIPLERKLILEKISGYILAKLEKKQEVKLIYVCIHNSRRSHFGQVWAKIASEYYGIAPVASYSGGTEVSAMHPNTLAALERAGVVIIQESVGENPIYKLHYDSKREPITCYSKRFDTPENPQSGFAAIMTCGEAEVNCPFVPGADLRVSTTYGDPKEADDKPEQDMVYDERCRQVAREALYVFSEVKNKIQ